MGILGVQHPETEEFGKIDSEQIGQFDLILFWCSVEHVTPKRVPYMSNIRRSVILIYFAVITFCAVMIIVGNFLGPNASVSIVNVASEGFKIALSALVGALSATLGGGNSGAK